MRKENPMPNYHALRVGDYKNVDKASMRTTRTEVEGLQVLRGIDRSRGGWIDLSLRFHKDQWTPEQAKAWATHAGYKVLFVEPARPKTLESRRSNMRPVSSHLVQPADPYRTKKLHIVKVHRGQPRKTLCGLSAADGSGTVFVFAAAAGYRAPEDMCLNCLRSWQQLEED